MYHVCSSYKESLIMLILFVVAVVIVVLVVLVVFVVLVVICVLAAVVGALTFDVKKVVLMWLLLFL